VGSVACVGGFGSPQERERVVRAAHRAQVWGLVSVCSFSQGIGLV
jgi:hypothetical protein